MIVDLPTSYTPFTGDNPSIWDKSSMSGDLLVSEKPTIGGEQAVDVG